MLKPFAAFCGALLLAGSPLAIAGEGVSVGNGKTAHAASNIAGDYMEARNADIYTGPCFSNAEIFITGNQAVMAWKVNRGSWDGVDLSGLAVAAAVRGTTTLSVDKPEEARSVLMVDKSASPRQRDALIAMAKNLAGARLSNVVDVKVTQMTMTLEGDDMTGSEAASAEHKDHGMPHTPKAFFWAVGVAEILTRPLDDGDHFCGNERVEYPPLSHGVTAHPAYTLGHKFNSKGLDSKWNDPNCRSSFVGHFSL
jgi:hypothetical protein